MDSHSKCQFNWGFQFVVDVLLLVLPCLVPVSEAWAQTAQTLFYQPGNLTLAEGQGVGNAALGLYMQNDGNLVVYANGQPIWASDTAGQCPGCVAYYQTDGNLVLYENNSTAIWSLHSVGSIELFIQSAAPYVSTVTAPAAQTLFYQPGNLTLAEGQQVGNENLNLIMQNNGNLVVNANGKPLWTSNTAGQCPGCVAYYQTDGNLVLYENNSTPVWSLNSAGSTELFIQGVAPYVSTVAATPVSTPGCNSVDLWQIPGMSNLFIGRQLINTVSTNPCSGENWSLVLEQMNWNTHSPNILDTILKPPVTISQGTLTSAYDASIVKFNGEYWVAFECGGTVNVGTPNEVRGGASSCIGPFDPSHPGKGIDLSRTYVVVFGGSAIPNDTYTYSASVPKLFVYQGNLYLYWAAIQMLAAPPNTWIQDTTRGTQLVQQSGGKRLLWSKGTNGPIASYDPQTSTEVWGVNPNDPTSNELAEMFQVSQVGDVLYAPGALGGNGCLNSVVNGAWSPGCARLAISVATEPLGYHIFNQKFVPEDWFPANPMGYTHLFYQPNGSPFLMGDAAPSLITEQSLPAGMFFLPLSTDSPILEFGQ